MTTYARVAAVTGANKGIGLAIVRNLALQYPGSALNTGPLLIYLTARDTSRGQAALDALHQDAQLLKAKVLSAQGGPVSLTFHQLDISSPTSIDAFASFLAHTHSQIDIVINNAGIALDGFNATVAHRTLATNYHGTLHATLTLLPLLRPSPLSRLINLASTAGTLSAYPPPLRARFRAAAAPPNAPTAHAATAPTTALMQDFAAAVAAGQHAARGWPGSAYAVSKAGVIGATAAVGAWEGAAAEREGRAARGVWSCCPGWVATEMTKGRGARGVDEGAGVAVGLAVGEEGRGGRGGFWEGGGVGEW
ncbi:carbonyl reductase [Neofusicoccum parvum]|uniref:Carbonyl reductase n=1 Tax=Neofusicoccum parvum TaxID=310453 RepID=A0ACB5SQK1_9PEZI|nr:carbonyl reductase [Neofusicoccum parvum]